MSRIWTRGGSSYLSRGPVPGRLALPQGVGMLAAVGRMALPCGEVMGGLGGERHVGRLLGMRRYDLDLGRPGRGTRGRPQR